MSVLTFPSIFLHIRRVSESLGSVLQPALMTTFLANALMVIGVSLCTVAVKEKSAWLVLLLTFKGSGAERNSLLTKVCIGIICTLSIMELTHTWRVSCRVQGICCKYWTFFGSWWISSISDLATEIVSCRIIPKTYTEVCSIDTKIWTYITISVRSTNAGFSVIARADKPSNWVPITIISRPVSTV